MNNNPVPQLMVTIDPWLKNINDYKEMLKDGTTLFKIDLNLNRKMDIDLVINKINRLLKNRNNDNQLLLDFSICPVLGNIRMLPIKVNEIIEARESNDSSEYLPLIGLNRVSSHLKVGNRIIFEDGQVIFEVIEIINEECIRLNCLKNDVPLRPDVISILPDTQFSNDVTSIKDLEFIKYLVKSNLKPNYIAYPYTNTREVIQLKNLITLICDTNYQEKSIKMITKVETIQAIKNLNFILVKTDGVLLDRGGIMFSSSAFILPKIQKNLLSQVKNSKKITILSSGIFKQFLSHGFVNRAELSDISLAVQQHVDILVLDKPKKSFSHLIEAVKLIEKIIMVEKCYDLSGKSTYKV
ncbi:pyruvate kinase [Bacillus sp. CH_442]|uniref:pyruvate kinase n=1 Tax=Bacillus sp. CH_442 TaxID=2978217 RepID=UPI0030F6A565|nr:hypothetical protein [Bacillus thuringiensis]